MLPQPKVTIAVHRARQRIQKLSRDSEIVKLTLFPTMGRKGSMICALAPVGSAGFAGSRFRGPFSPARSRAAPLDFCVSARTCPGETGRKRSPFSRIMARSSRLSSKEPGPRFSTKRSTGKYPAAFSSVRTGARSQEARRAEWRPRSGRIFPWSSRVCGPAKGLKVGAAGAQERE